MGGIGFGALAAGADAEGAGLGGHLLLAGHAFQRRGHVGVDALGADGVAAGFHEGAHGFRRFGLAEDDAVHAAAEDLPELPGIVQHIGFRGAVDGRFHHHGGGTMAGAGGAAIDQAAHVGGEAGHVEGAVLHADVDIVGPGAGIDLALLVGEHVPGVVAGVVDADILLQQLDAAVDARHGSSPVLAEG